LLTDKFGTHTDWSYFRVKSVKQSERRHTTTNALGASVSIIDRNFKEYGLVPLGVLQEQSGNIVATVPLTADLARRARTSGRVLLIYHLLNPYVFNSAYRLDPESDNPVAATVQGHYLIASLDAIWLYDIASGAIIAKLDKYAFSKAPLP
jgi:hypothetical protein